MFIFGLKSHICYNFLRNLFTYIKRVFAIVCNLFLPSLKIEKKKIFCNCTDFESNIKIPILFVQTYFIPKCSTLSITDIDIPVSYLAFSTNAC